ncbi:hypothetical protein GLOIN_2v971331 [Rhizophagus irregularis DAOM 181602=DAOM 197198]|nr:hypothetical protein GLOIN_2v971331 [Rhizophagus irregularis DAOM 181602=DAOM 197198]
MAFSSLMEAVRKTLRFLVSLFFASEIEQSEPDVTCTICFDDIKQAQAYTKFAYIFLRRMICPNCRGVVHEPQSSELIGPGRYLGGNTLSNRDENLHPGRGQYNVVVPQLETFPNIPGSFHTFNTAPNNNIRRISLSRPIHFN